MSIVGRFRLIVPGATAKAAPKLGQALGPLGINMVNFCKDFNARTTKVRPKVPIQATLVPRTDRTYKFFIRSPQAPWFLLRCARLPKGSDYGNGAPAVGNITLKELYHIAKAKSMDPQFIGIPTRTICLSLMRTAKQMGIKITRELDLEFAKRNDEPVEGLEERRKQLRLLNKASKKGKKKWVVAKMAYWILDVFLCDAERLRCLICPSMRPVWQFRHTSLAGQSLNLEMVKIRTALAVGKLLNHIDVGM